MTIGLNSSGQNVIFNVTPVIDTVVSMLRLAVDSSLLPLLQSSPFVTFTPSVCVIREDTVCVFLLGREESCITSITALCLKTEEVYVCL